MIIREKMRRDCECIDGKDLMKKHEIYGFLTSIIFIIIIITCIYYTA